MSDESTGTVESMAFGGQGILRENGLVVFVPFALPGEVVNYTISTQKKSFAQGQLLSILQPSQHRISPACQHFETCGGCQLQHLDYAQQLKQKQRWVHDALQRIGGLKEAGVLPTMPAEQQWFYRRRISLTLVPEGKCYRVGYHAADGKSLVEVKKCSIFSEKAPFILQWLRDVCSQLIPEDQTEGKVSLLNLEDGRFSLHFHFKRLPKNAEECLRRMSHESLDVVLHSPQRTISFGQDSLKRFVCEGHEFYFSPVAFVQNHPEQSAKIYREIVQTAASKPRQHILDLYCGIGISTLLLAKQAHTIGIELNKEAIKMAESNLKNGSNGNATFVQGDVDQLTHQYLKKKKPDLLLMNPPRTGLSQAVLSAIAQHQPNELIYVSCMPTTLARDLKFLSQQGYSIVKCQPFDMFPQTTHVEVLVHLQQTTR